MEYPVAREPELYDTYDEFETQGYQPNANYEEDAVYYETYDYYTEDDS